MSNKNSGTAKEDNSLAENKNRPKAYLRYKKRVHFVVRLSLRKREGTLDLTRDLIFDHVIVMPDLRELIVAQERINFLEQNQDHSFVVFIITMKPIFEGSVLDYMSDLLVGTPVKFTTDPRRSLECAPEMTIGGLIKRNFNTTVSAVTRVDHDLCYGRALNIDPGVEILLDIKKFHHK